MINIKATDRIQGFPPLITECSQVLILGSMPGNASLKAQAYYAHPRNAFWPIMSELFGVDNEAAYDERVTQLLSQGVALWDVLHACERKGSLDSAIKTDSQQVNDFASLFTRYPSIEQVFCNGRKAWQTYHRFVQKPLGSDAIEAECLPSTSPAHASLTLSDKVSAWSAVKRIFQEKELIRNE